MKLTRLEDVPDEVDEKLFKTRHKLRTDVEGNLDLRVQRWTADYLRSLGNVTEMRNEVAFVWKDGVDPDEIDLSAFGVLNGIFMHYCPGFRLMVTEEPNEPRRIWICKEEA